MTIDQIAEIGQRLLGEHKPRLKVQGIKKFDKVLATRIGHPIEYRLEDLEPDRAEAMIRSVLTELESKGDFVMSEPEISGSQQNFQMKNIKDGELRLSFAYGAEASQPFKPILWIACWMYPFHQPK